MGADGSRFRPVHINSAAKDYTDLRLQRGRALAYALFYALL